MRSFEEIVASRPDLWNCLGNAARRGRLAHAFLITSDATREREEFALALAALAVCEQKSGQICGKCANCRRIQNDTYPEMYHLSPVGKGYQIQIGDRTNPENNTVRHFEEQFFLTSSSDDARKIGIIHHADRMNQEAQNALLKTLEEPPRDTMIILTTGNPSALLPTTRSRCQSIQLFGNELRYDFDGGAELFAALNMLAAAPDGDLAAADAVTRRLLQISGAFRLAADEEAHAEFGERSEGVDPGFTKNLDKRQEDSASGSYMRLRQEFLAAIHSFCGQLYMLAQGVACDALPLPDIMEAKTAVTPERAGKMLAEADALLFNLRFNVNEELALRNFAIQCLMPGR